MVPPKSRSKQRLYRKRDIEFVWLLKRLLWDERYTIAGARQRIQELGVEEALGLLLTPIQQARSEESDQASIRSDPMTATDWSSIRAALDAMRSDLVALRGTLQETA